MIIAPIALRIYQPQSLLFPEGACMPPNASPAPPCLLCDRISHAPPAKAVWISAGGEERFGVICGHCDWNRSETELERRIIERISAPAPAEAA